MGGAGDPNSPPASSALIILVRVMKCECNMFQVSGICYHTGYKPFPSRRTEIMVDELITNLDQGFAEGWRPKEGDKIVGKVTDLASGWSDYQNEGYPIITVHDEETDKDVAIHCFHFVLRKEVAKLKPVPGDRMAVLYKGETPTKDGRRMVKNYTVRVEGKTGAEGFWDREQAPDPVVEAAKEAVQEKQDDDLPF